ncbi:hypothetical protein DFA_04935 [Cavenderia fasciculata]|uniref:Uncharacterized protein n=1 Tax=Cavenderia fasciculata TaxID=261658 RepID=F4PMF5_CACFS|nr:uncharacterized protein DFA_04935 [Cavenderia fasciculata]EGG22805.1 hypothetical protein DFA_04935 [Cavenderia fasciculata]|eukprot:XP_004360656.1 hypothetical protein DFA_04935 [Cavenderia fasciculata]
MVKADNCNQTASVQSLITETLKFFKQTILDRINIIHQSDVLWVITVPTIWDDAAKQIIRQCAIAAGLCTIADDKESILLSYEAECGALDCIFEKRNSYRISEGQTVLVFDIGGATADFTVGATEILVSAVQTKTQITSELINLQINKTIEPYKFKIKLINYNDTMDIFLFLKMFYTLSNYAPMVGTRLPVLVTINIVRYAWEMDTMNGRYSEENRILITISKLLFETVNQLCVYPVTRSHTSRAGLSNHKATGQRFMKNDSFLKAKAVYSCTPKSIKRTIIYLNFPKRMVIAGLGCRKSPERALTQARSQEFPRVYA